MQILIVGSGKVGYTVTGRLASEGHDVTIIDKRSGVLSKTQNDFDVITVQGNGASMETLKDADVEKKDMIIAVTNADEANMIACITAKFLNPKIKCIARIRNPEYVEQAHIMSDEMNLALVINPERQAAHEISSLIKLPGSLNRETFEKARMEMIEIRLEETSRLCGRQMKDISIIAKAKVLVCVVERNEQVIIPDGSFVMEAGDKLYLTGDLNNMRTLLYELGYIQTDIKRVMIAGGGRISYYLARELEHARISTTIIEQNEARCEELSTLLPKETIVCGDASSQSTLDDEEMDDYDAFVSCTGLDELNIVTSMYAALSHVPLTITKVGRGENIKVLNNLPIGPLVCPKDLCTDHIVRYVRAMNSSEGNAAESIHKIADGKAEVLEFTVKENTRHTGEYFRNMPIKKNILIATVTDTDGRHSIIAGGDNTYHVGDTVVIVTAADDVITTLNDIFEE
jgi:trk system potassium uptake protein TrkA